MIQSARVFDILALTILSPSFPPWFNYFFHVTLSGTSINITRDVSHISSDNTLRKSSWYISFFIRLMEPRLLRAFGARKIRGSTHHATLTFRYFHACDNVCPNLLFSHYSSLLSPPLLISRVLPRAFVASAVFFSKPKTRRWNLSGSKATLGAYLARQ